MRGCHVGRFQRGLPQAVPKQAGESEAAYESRLERTYNDMVSESIKKVTKKSEKRKAYVDR
jgi:hypothetical protein